MSILAIINHLKINLIFSLEIYKVKNKAGTKMKIKICTKSVQKTAKNWEEHHKETLHKESTEI